MVRIIAGYEGKKRIFPTYIHAYIFFNVNARFNCYLERRKIADSAENNPLSHSVPICPTGRLWSTQSFFLIVSFWVFQHEMVRTFWFLRCTQYGGRLRWGGRNFGNYEGRKLSINQGKSDKILGDTIIMCKLFRIFKIFAKRKNRYFAIF